MQTQTATAPAPVQAPAHEFTVEATYPGRGPESDRVIVRTLRAASTYMPRELAIAAGLGPRHFGYSVRTDLDDTHVAEVRLHND